MRLTSVVCLTVALVAVAALAVSAALPPRVPVDSETRTLFSMWVQQYKREYANSEEYQSRLQVFAQNLLFIKEHNSRGFSFTLGLNRFADMTNLEYRQAMLGGYRPSNRTRKFISHAAVDVSTLPTTVDWRQKGVVTPIKNQGQCGSCWSFSSTGSMEGAHALATGQLVSLSEQQLIDCVQGGSFTCDTGGDMQDAFQYVINTGGIEGESDYPYCTCSGNACRASPAKFRAKISSYQNVATNENALQQAVANQPTVSIAIDASSQQFQLYSGGVFDYPFCSSTQLDHGVLAVGYGTYNGKDYWLVKNSWGPEWGLQGYIMMTRNKNNQCGVATDASYPVV